MNRMLMLPGAFLLLLLMMAAQSRASADELLFDWLSEPDSAGESTVQALTSLSNPAPAAQTAISPAIVKVSDVKAALPPVEPPSSAPVNVNRITPQQIPVPPISERATANVFQPSVNQKEPQIADAGNKRSGTLRDWFRKMVAQALAHSPEIREALSHQEAADWSISQVKGQRYPQVLVGSGAPFGSFGSGKSTRHNSSLKDAHASVSVTTTLFDWGKIRSELEGAMEGLSASTLSIREARESIASSTITELLNMARYRESINAAEAYVKRMNELVKMLSGIAAADKGRVSERVQAEARLLSARAEQARLQQLYDHSRIKLVRLMGVEPELLPDMRWRDGLIPQAAALEGLANHPTLMRAKAEIRAAQAQAAAIKADGLPKVNWVVQKSTAKDAYGDEDAWYTGLNLQWNAFDGGTTRAARQVSLAKMRAAQEKQQTSRFELSYQINNGVAERDASLTRARGYVQLSAQTDRVRDMFYRQWYNLGSRTLLDVLTAESDYFSNRLSAINHFYDGYVSNVSVMYSAGLLLRWLAGYSPELRQPQ